MEKKTYYCDKCKKQVEKEDDLKAISIGYGSMNYSYGHSSNYKEILRSDLCSSCAEKIGLIERKIKDNKIIEQDVPNLADKLYDIVCQIVQENSYQGE